MIISGPRKQIRHFIFTLCLVISILQYSQSNFYTFGQTESIVQKQKKTRNRVKNWLLFIFGAIFAKFGYEVARLNSQINKIENSTQAELDEFSKQNNYKKMKNHTKGSLADQTERNINQLPESKGISV